MNHLTSPNIKLLSQSEKYSHERCEVSNEE